MIQKSDNSDNYRDVSLISCLYKLLTCISNRRLGKFCKENDVLSLAQLGFVPENRTSDAHFILHKGEGSEVVCVFSRLRQSV